TDGMTVDSAKGRKAAATSPASYARWVFGRQANTRDAIGPKAAAMPGRSLSFKMPVTRMALRPENVSVIEAARAIAAGRLWAPSTTTRGDSRTISIRAGQRTDSIPERIASSGTVNPAVRSSSRAATAMPRFSTWKETSKGGWKWTDPHDPTTTP